jgi:CheY-like chemotaxis protein
LGKRRNVPPGGRGLRPFAEFDSVPDNVITLDAHRWRRNRAATHTLLYINEGGDWLDLLASVPTLRVANIQSEEMLRSSLVAAQPDLILIDSRLEWHDLVALTAYLHDLVQVPIVMICNAPPSAKTSQLLKQAYAVGLHDAVFAPLRREEIFESLEVLLKFRRQQPVL